MPHPTYKTELRGARPSVALAERVEVARRTPHVGCRTCRPNEACSPHITEALVAAVNAEELVLMSLHDVDEIIYMSVERLTADRLAGEGGPPNRTAEMLASLKHWVVTSSNDWSTADDFVRLYAVLVGWTDEDGSENLTRFVDRFGWSDDLVAKLRRYHAVVEAHTDPDSQVAPDGTPVV